LRQSGAIITSIEMAIYELLEKAGTREFKETLGLVKSKSLPGHDTNQR